MSSKILRANELKLNNVTDEEKVLIDKLKSKLIKANFTCIITLLISFFVLLIPSIGMIIDKYVNIIAILLLAFFYFVIYVIFINSIKTIKYLKNNSYQRAEYGKVKNKFYHSGKSSLDTGFMQGHVSVSFDDNSRYIVDVMCNKKIYNKLNLADDVLVVSFDNKTSYIIYPSNNYISNDNFKSNEDDMIKIKANKLKRYNITNEEIKDSKELAKDLFGASVVFALLFVPFYFMILFKFFADRSGDIKISIATIIVYAIMLLFGYINVHLILEAFYVYKGSKGYYKHAEYGIVIDKVLKEATDSDGHKETDYYIKVKFPDRNVYIERVICDRLIFSKLSLGSSVLVISYGNKSCYALIPKK